MIQQIGTDYFKGQEQKIYLLCGKAGGDGSLKTFDSGKTKGSVSVHAKDTQDGKAIWVRVAGWGHDAYTPAGVKKGETVLAIGRMEVRDRDDGGKFYDLTADYISVNGRSAGSVEKSAGSGAPAEFEEVEEVGTLPF